MQFIDTDTAPRAGGHYSQAVVHGGLIYVAGQLPIVPGQQPGNPGSVAEQVEQTLRNVEAIVVAAGGALNTILQMTVYITDVKYWGEVNSAFARVLGAHKPARAIVPVPELHFGYAVEIQAVASVR